MPCVIFFDEIDALCPKRTEGDNSATSRVVNQMLTEMDGVESRQGVFLMAATNRPDIIDPAVLRPGRLDKILYVGLPTASDRVDILRAVTKVFTYIYVFYMCVYKHTKKYFSVLNDLYLLS